MATGLILLATPDLAIAQSTWVGGSDADFANGTNWSSTPDAPGAGDTAIVDSSGTYDPMASDDTTINILEISAGELTVDGATLSVIDAVRQSGGTLTSANSGIVVTDTYAFSDGTLDADVQATTFAQTGGTIGTGSVTSDIEVIAIGGTVTTIGKSGIDVTGASDGDISITTTEGGAIENTTAGAAGINTSASGGDTTITLGANVDAEGDGIHASTTGKGDVTITGKGNVTGGTDAGDDGIEVSIGSGTAKVTLIGDITGDPGIVMNSTTGGSFTIDGTGDITGTVAAGVSLTTSGGDGTIIVTQDGTITGKTDGVYATTSGPPGLGTILVTAAEGEAIIGETKVGVSATAESGSVTVNGKGDISGVTAGVEASGGDVTVSGSGKTSSSGAGSKTIDATSASGDVIVDRSGQVSNTGTGETSGVFAQGTGATDGNVTVTTGGLDIAGTNSYGINAQLTDTGSTGTVTVNGSGDVVSTGSGFSFGIFATNAGTGDVKVGGTGKTTTSGENSISIYARGSAATAHVVVDRSGLITNTGSAATYGINARTAGTSDGDIIVKASGGVKMAGVGSTAIRAEITGDGGSGGMTISDVGAIVSTGTGQSNGISVTSGSTGLVDIDSGAITLADESTGFGILAGTRNGGNITIDNGGAINGGAGGMGAAALASGTATLTTGAAIGGTDSVSAVGIMIMVVNGQGQANIGHDITSDGFGVSGLGTGTGLLDINHSAGKITAGTIGIDASQTSTGLIDIDLTGKAAIDSAGIGVQVYGASTVATLDIGADAVVDGATDAVLSKAGTFTAGNSGTVTSAGNAVNVGAGTTTFTNRSGGEVFGNLASAALATSLTVDNQQGGNWTLNNGGTSTLAGGDDEIGNAGLFRASGTTTVTGLESFTNAATGVFEVNAVGGPAANVTFASLGSYSNAGTMDLSNGVIGDRLTLDGGFKGIAGSTINVDIDLGPNNPGGTPQLGDQIVVTNGAFTGSSNIGFNVVDVTDLGLQDSPIIVVDLDPNQDNTGTFTSTGLPALGGLIEYQFGQIGEDWGVTSTVNLSAAGGIAANITLAQSIIGTVVNRPSSPYVSGLAGNADYYAGPAVWMRGVGGAANASAGVSDDFGFTSEAQIDLTYLGGQVGADLGWFNIDGTDLTINAGITGGYNAGRTSQDVMSTFTGKVTSITDGEFDSRYAGVYMTVAKARYFADIQARFDRTDFTFNNAVVGLTDAKVDSDRFSVNGSVGYAASLGNDYTLVPSIGLSYARTQTSSVTFDNGATMDPRDYDSWMGFAGATLVRTIILPDQLSAVSPFITGTIYNDFGDDPASVFTFGDAQRVVTTENIGTFGEISLGADYVRVFATRTDGTPLKQLNANVRGDFKFSDRLLAAGVNVQMRLQF